MTVLFKSVSDQDFHIDIHIFSAPPVLKEMLLYAHKWNKLLTEDEEQIYFLKAMLQSLPHFCNEIEFSKIPVPTDFRLKPVCNYINSNYQSSFDINNLAEMAQMSVRSLQQIFKNETGITLQKYMQLIRILKNIEFI